MKISIVTPSYNQGQFIEEAILSVLNQGYEDFEHIVIDAGSTDETIGILRKYAHLNWVSEPDKGQSDALNKGFKKAKGDIVGWLNADDVYLPGAFKVVEENFKINSFDALYGNYSLINKHGNVTRSIITQNSSKWMSLFYCYIPSTTFFFKRSIIESGLLIDQDFHIAMDKEFFAHIFYSGYNIGKCDFFIANFRWHDSNKSIDTPKVKAIRIREGVITFNRYSRYSLPDNRFGFVVYSFFIYLCKVYRGISRLLGVGIFKR
jgi:glycosyltransferase involved in cell wall biosynthesis